MMLANRLWSKIKVGSADECWPWVGKKNKLGYGSISTQRSGVRKDALAHRVVMEMARGSISDELCVCHSCDVPSCCNPKHLWIGTRRDNNLDKMAKNRSRSGRGEAFPNAKLKDSDIQAIRSDPRTIREIGAAYNIAHSSICRIKRGAAWRHV